MIRKKLNWVYLDKFTCPDKELSRQLFVHAWPNLLCVGVHSNYSNLLCVNEAIEAGCFGPRSRTIFNQIFRDFVKRIQLNS